MDIDKLYNVIINTKKTTPKNSYIISLLESGTDRILQKVGEEAIEVIISAKGKDKNKIVLEVTDLWFHILVLLSHLDIKPKDIYDELEKRSKKI